MPTPILNIERLEKRFGNVEMLKDISLSMQKGEFLVLLGPPYRDRRAAALS